MADFFRDRHWGKSLIGAFLLLIGLACTTVLVVNLAKDLSIWVLGRHTTAYVTDMWVERTSDVEESELTFQYFVQYQFMLANGQTITRVTTVAPQEWAGLGITIPSFDRAASVGEESGSPVVYREQKHVPEFSVGGLEESSPVDVLYFPLYPRHNRLDDSRFIPLLLAAYIPILCLALVGTLGGWNLIASANLTVRAPSLGEILNR